MKDEDEGMRIEQVVLDAYFQCRSNRQELNMVQDNKTTQQIIDETADTLELDDKTVAIFGADKRGTIFAIYDISRNIGVVTYMVEHGYLFTEDDDGSPIWMIYRMR